jgi:hypothetical protein
VRRRGSHIFSRHLYILFLRFYVRTQVQIHFDEALSGIFRQGRPIVRAVSRWLPSTAARVRHQVMWDFWWTKCHWGRFSPSTSVSPVNLHPPIAPQSPSSIIWAWCNRPVVAAIPIGLSLTAIIIIIIIIIVCCPWQICGEAGQNVSQVN